MEDSSLDGFWKADPITKEFDISLELSTGIKIRSIGRSFLNAKESDIPTHNAIYVLEGNEIYVGQSKNVKKRLKDHVGTNKNNFHRCFILHHTKNMVSFLDFMENYTIQELETQGYKLLNVKKADPEEQNLTPAQKNDARKWINEFLLFLPILGFKKNKLLEKEYTVTQTNINNITIEEDISNTVLSRKKAISKRISAKLNGEYIDGKSSFEIFSKCILEIGVKEILDKCGSIFSETTQIKDFPFSGKHGKAHPFIEKDGKTFYFYANISNKDKINKLNKIKTILKLKQFNVEFEEVKEVSKVLISNEVDVKKTVNKKNITKSIEKKNQKLLIKFNGLDICESNNRETFIKTIQVIGLSKIFKNCSNIFGTGLMISDKPIEPIYHVKAKLYKDEKTGKEFYIRLNISNRDLFKKIKYIKEILKLDNLIILIL